MQPITNLNDIIENSKHNIINKSMYTVFVEPITSVCLQYVKT